MAYNPEEYDFSNAEADPEIVEQEKEGRQEIIQGIVLVAIGAGITVGTFLAAGPGGTYYITYGGVAVGAFQIIKGLTKATGFWRLVGFTALVVTAVVAFLTYQAAQDTSSFYNEITTGDCVDVEGLKADCDDRATVAEVVGTYRYDSDRAFPGVTQVDADAERNCPFSWYFMPTRESWSEGDRTILCVTTLIKAGDCVGMEGLETDCDDRNSRYQVIRTYEYDSNRAFPGATQLDADAERNCPSNAEWFFVPTRETWDAGDRSILCVTER